MSSRRPGMRWSILGIAVIVAAGVGGAAVALWAPVPQPSALSTPRPETTVPVTERSFADERQAQLQVSTGPARAVVAPRPGRLTALTCRTGATVASGAAFASIDGAPIVALATAIPLWRELRSGDRGEDVRALQQELARLGHPIQADGVMGRATIRGASTLHGAQADSSESPATVDPADFAWIPEHEVAVGECSGVVGAPVGEGDVLIGLPVAVVSARLTTLPTNATPGPRVMRVGSAVIPVGDDGAVTDDDGLARLGESAEFAATGGTDDTAIAVQWSLETPLRALALPPSALWDVREGFACVMPAEKSAVPLLVEVLGSELGQSFVRVPEDRSVKAVRSAPPKSRSCR